jgi:hypothetical protein
MSGKSIWIELPNTLTPWTNYFTTQFIRQCLKDHFGVFCSLFAIKEINPA